MAVAIGCFLLAVAAVLWAMLREKSLDARQAFDYLLPAFCVSALLAIGVSTWGMVVLDVVVWGWYLRALFRFLNRPKHPNRAKIDAAIARYKARTAK